MNKLKENWWQFLTFVVYLLLLESTIFVHASWHDEVQAWLLARDADIFSLFFRYIRYEGTPGLWHLILVIPAKLKLPVIFLNLIAGIIMAAAVYLIIFRSTFPKVIKILLPFSYFFLYQYGVVARSYCLIPLLLFLLATMYEKKNERPFAFYTLLILLASASLHGTLIAMSLLAIHLGGLAKKWSELSAQQKRRNYIGIAVFVLVLVIIVIMLIPPSDLSSKNHLYDFSKSHLWYTFNDSVLQSLTGFWFMSFPPPEFLLAYSLLVVLLLWLVQRKLILVYLTMAVPLFIFLMVVYTTQVHYGTLFSVLIFVLWISFDKESEARRRIPRLEKLPLKQIATAALVIVLLFQVFYTVQSVRAEYRVKYSASRSIAQYIKQNGLENKRINMLGIQTHVLAYFDDNIFQNYNGGHKPCFWLYSTKNNHIININKANIKKAVSDKPDYILASYAEMSKFDFKIPGYDPEVVFYGDLIWQGHTLNLDAAILYRRE